MLMNCAKSCQTCPLLRIALEDIPEYNSKTPSQCFKDIDEDGNGHISKAELKDWWKSATTTEPVPFEDFSRADRNGDESVTQEEFMGIPTAEVFFEELTRDGVTYALDAFGFEVDIHGGMFISVS
jgi:Ca2+-binding EF-hand superfamily protein